MVLQPFIQKSFELLMGDFIDPKLIDLNQLSINGIKNLELDADKINQKFFQKSLLQVNRLNFGSIKVNYNLQKKLTVTLEDVLVDLFPKEDFTGEEDKPASQEPVEKEGARDQEKLVETLRQYEIEVTVVNL